MLVSVEEMGMLVISSLPLIRKSAFALASSIRTQVGVIECAVMRIAKKWAEG